MTILELEAAQRDAAARVAALRTDARNAFAAIERDKSDFAAANNALPGALAAHARISELLRCARRDQEQNSDAIEYHRTPLMAMLSTRLGGDARARAESYAQAEVTPETYVTPQMYDTTRHAEALRRQVREIAGAA